MPNRVTITKMIKFVFILSIIFDLLDNKNTKRNV